MEKITRRAMELAQCYGASAVGIATIDTLAGGPPSTDLTYVLPTARAAISFAVPLNQDDIELWFSKKSHAKHFKDNIRANVMASGISLELANYLGQKGYPSIPLTANTAYREESPNGRYDEFPPISHRYLAVRSGVGFFGLSGNVLTQSEGGAVILGSVVTAAELKPTDPLAALSPVHGRLRFGLYRWGKPGVRNPGRHRFLLFPKAPSQPLRLCLRRFYRTAQIRQVVDLVARPLSHSG